MAMVVCINVKKMNLQIFTIQTNNMVLLFGILELRAFYSLFVVHSLSIVCPSFHLCDVTKHNYSSHNSKFVNDIYQSHHILKYLM